MAGLLAVLAPNTVFVTEKRIIIIIRSPARMGLDWGTGECEYGALKNTRPGEGMMQASAAFLIIDGLTEISEERKYKIWPQNAAGIINAISKPPRPRRSTGTRTPKYEVKQSIKVAYAMPARSAAP